MQTLNGFIGSIKTVMYLKKCVYLPNDSISDIHCIIRSVTSPGKHVYPTPSCSPYLCCCTGFRPYSSFLSPLLFESLVADFPAGAPCLSQSETGLLSWRPPRNRHPRHPPMLHNGSPGASPPSPNPHTVDSRSDFAERPSKSLPRDPGEYLGLVSDWLNSTKRAFGPSVLPRGQWYTPVCRRLCSACDSSAPVTPPRHLAVSRPR